MVTSTNMSCGVFPNRRTKPRLEWRIASDTARLAALVASRPWTSTPMPISVMQRTRAIALLPLDRAGRLAGDVIDHAVDALDLVDDAGGDIADELHLEGIEVRGHAIGR